MCPLLHRSCTGTKSSQGRRLLSVIAKNARTSQSRRVLVRDRSSRSSRARSRRGRKEKYSVIDRSIDRPSVVEAKSRVAERTMRGNGETIVVLLFAIAIDRLVSFVRRWTISEGNSRATCATDDRQDLRFRAREEDRAGEASRRARTCGAKHAEMEVRCVSRVNSRSRGNKHRLAGTGNSNSRRSLATPD